MDVEPKEPKEEPQSVNILAPVATAFVQILPNDDQKEEES